MNTGLGFWAGRVIEELRRADRTFELDPVHDLRVALRRCRSMTDVLFTVDPDPAWKQLKKLGKELFSRLGNLRDVQVMEQWLDRLGQAEDSVRTAVAQILASQAAHFKYDAQVAVHAFDERSWQAVSERLAARTRTIPLEGLVFQHVAREAWQQAHDQHRRALRNRTQVSLHRLRIALKKFRYTLENFLPERHARWGADLKYLQDLLGEIHDLDVLAGIVSHLPHVTGAERELWRMKIQQERQQRLAIYREKMLGQGSLWHEWQRGLPNGARLEEAALVRLRTWARFLDLDVEHAKHVTQLALQLYDGLARGKILSCSSKQRRILKTAALLHDVGIAKGNHAHHKHSYRMIRKLIVPLGWTAEELSQVGAVARYHRGALPRPEHSCLRRLPASARASVIQLAGVLRLANAFDLSHDKKVRRLAVKRTNGAIIVESEGYNPTGAIAERVAAARHLLETSCQVAVVVRPCR